MRHCDYCDEPVAKSIFLQDSEGRSRKAVLCYIHAAESGVLDGPLNDLLQLGRDVDYPTNGLFFVFEAVARAESTNSAEDVSTAIIRSARERFGSGSRNVLKRWKILDRPDIGSIYDALVRAKLLPKTDIRRSDFERGFRLGEVLDAIAEDEQRRAEENQHGRR